jgi:hypothetical protein
MNALGNAVFTFSDTSIPLEELSVREKINTTLISKPESFQAAVS